MNPEESEANALILVIDDDSDVRESTVRILEKSGFRVVSGATAAEAVRLTRQHHPALVLLDVVLPDGSGVVTAQTLKQDPALAGAFVILLSGIRVSPEDQAEGLSKGLADGYISRPFSQVEFLARIDAFLRIRAAKQALMASNHFLQATLDALSANIALLDEQGTILLVNNAWRDFAMRNGLSADKASRGSNYLEVCDSAVGEDMAEARLFADGIRAVIAGSADTFMLEYPCDSPDEKRWFIGRVTRFPVDGPSRVVVAHENITDRKRVEEERRLWEKRGQQLQKAESLNRMAGAIAHNFNNHLQVVIGNLEMAMDDLPQNSASAEILTDALKAARKASDVSSLMLAYRGQTYVKLAPLDLSAACRQSLNLLQAAAPKGMILMGEIPASDMVIRGNEGQIHQVLSNLVTNAWESVHGDRGIIRVTVKRVSLADISELHRVPVDWQPQDASFACMEVSDTGSGIAGKDIEKIFDPFFSTKFTGRGMGLSVVRGIVGAHGGGITVESKPGQGSIFRVFLPISTEKVIIRPESVGKTAEMKGSGSILVIEDEAQVRTMVKKMLTRLGYTVITAEDGIEAVEIFRHHSDEIGCVISDLTMPHMDGWETLAALRSLSPDIPVILSSGYDETQAMAGEHAVQPDAFLGKPYRFKEIGETIRRVLTNKP